MRIRAWTPAAESAAGCRIASKNPRLPPRQSRTEGISSHRRRSLTLLIRVYAHLLAFPPRRRPILHGDGEADDDTTRIYAAPSRRIKPRMRRAGSKRVPTPAPIG